MNQEQTDILEAALKVVLYGKPTGVRSETQELIGTRFGRDLKIASLEILRDAIARRGYFAEQK